MGFATIYCDEEGMLKMDSDRGEIAKKFNTLKSDMIDLAENHKAFQGQIKDIKKELQEIQTKLKTQTCGSEDPALPNPKPGQVWRDPVDGEWIIYDISHIVESDTPIRRVHMAKQDNLIWHKSLTEDDLKKHYQFYWEPKVSIDR